MWVCSTGRQHLVYDALHKQYGDYVRFGPNHLHIRDAQAIPIVMGARNQWDRTEGLYAARHLPFCRSSAIAAYEASNPMGRVGSLMTLADATEHNRRRRVWDRAFTPAALKSYTPMLARRVSQFVACMDARAGAPLDLGDWFCLLTTDFMGDFACGGAFDLMERGGGNHDEQYHVIATEGVGLIEVIGKLPWCRAFIHYLPNPRLDRLMSYSLGIAEQRKQAGTQHKDLFYYLVRMLAYRSNCVC
jgi:cytochrome P450